MQKPVLELVAYMAAGMAGGSFAMPQHSSPRLLSLLLTLGDELLALTVSLPHPTIRVVSL